MQVRQAIETLTRDRRAIAAAGAAVLAAALFAGLLAVGCGSGDGDTDAASPSPVDSADAFAGTWVRVDDPDAGLTIEKLDASSYRVADPDRSNAFTARLSEDGTRLSGSFSVDEQDAPPMTVTVTITAGGDGLLDLEAVSAGERIAYRLRKT